MLFKALSGPDSEGGFLRAPSWEPTVAFEVFGFKPSERHHADPKPNCQRKLRSGWWGGGGPRSDDGSMAPSSQYSYIQCQVPQMHLKIMLMIFQAPTVPGNSCAVPFLIVMNCFLTSGYNILPEKELQRSLQVRPAAAWKHDPGLAAHGGLTR